MKADPVGWPGLLFCLYLWRSSNPVEPLLLLPPDANLLSGTGAVPWTFTQGN